MRRPLVYRAPDDPRPRGRREPPPAQATSVDEKAKVTKLRLRGVVQFPDGSLIVGPLWKADDWSHFTG